MAIRKPEEAHPVFAQACNAGDLESLSALYETDARLVPQPGQPPAAGIQAIREALQGFLALKCRITIETKSVIHAGDLALLRGDWRLTGTAPDGQPVEMSNISIEVLRRQPDGTWLFVIDHPFGAD